MRPFWLDFGSTGDKDDHLKQLLIELNSISTGVETEKGYGNDPKSGRKSLLVIHLNED